MGTRGSTGEREKECVVFSDEKLKFKKKPQSLHTRHALLTKPCSLLIKRHPSLPRQEVYVGHAEPFTAHSPLHQPSQPYPCTSRQGRIPRDPEGVQESPMKYFRSSRVTKD
jgi:hypothetical protein